MQIRSLFRRAAAAFAVFSLVAVGACGGGETKPADSPKDAPKDAPKGAPADDRASWPTELRVSAIPDVKPDQWEGIYNPIMAHLEKKLGIKVKFTWLTDYPSTVSGMAGKSLDLVWFGGYTSVQAASETKGNIERLVMRAEDKEFKTVFVANPNSGIKSLADLKGKSFTFGSTNSTSGNLMPRIFLKKAGIDVAKDFKGEAGQQANHDKTAEAVQNGTVDAGALNYVRWEQLVADKKVDTSKVAVFWTSPGYVDYCWTARKDLPASLKAAIKQAFLDLDASKPEDAAVLKGHKASKYIPADDAMWKQCEADAREIGLLK